MALDNSIITLSLLAKTVRRLKEYADSKPGESSAEIKEILQSLKDQIDIISDTDIKQDSIIIEHTDEIKRVLKRIETLEKSEGNAADVSASIEGINELIKSINQRFEEIADTDIKQSALIDNMVSKVSALEKKVSSGSLSAIAEGVSPESREILKALNEKIDTLADSLILSNYNMLVNSQA